MKKAVKTEIRRNPLKEAVKIIGILLAIPAVMLVGLFVLAMAISPVTYRIFPDNHDSW